MAIISPLPYTLTNGTTADASQVQADFAQIVANVNAAAAPIASPAFTGTPTLAGVSAVTGPLPLNGGAQINGYAYTPTVTNVWNSASQSINCALSNVFYNLLNASITTLTMSNPGDGQTINMYFKQGAGGSFTMAWPASFRWNAGVVPTLSTAAGNIDFLTASYNGGGSTWICALLKGVQ